MNNYYVYEYIRLDTNEVFYIGKGRGYRSHSLKNRNSYFNRIINKYPYKVVKVLENLSESDAFEAEVSFIKYRKSIGQAYCNLTDGGEGRSGSFVSSETKDKIRKHQTGRMISESTRKKMSEAKKGKTVTKTRNVSPETRLKMSLSKKQYYMSTEARAKTAKAMLGNSNGKKPT